MTRYYLVLIDTRKGEGNAKSFDIKPLDSSFHTLGNVARIHVESPYWRFEALNGSEGEDGCSMGWWYQLNAKGVHATVVNFGDPRTVMIAFANLRRLIIENPLDVIPEFDIEEMIERMTHPIP